MKKIFKIIGILAGIIILLFGLFYAYVIFVVFDDPFDNKNFDKITWAQFDDSSDPDNLRGEMYEDLIENYLSKGMTKKEVIDLLGEADYKSEEYFLSYNLGAWSSFRIDYDTLDLKFDKDGKLIKFYRFQH